MNDAIVTVVGNLTGDPTFSTSSDGRTRASFGLAQTPSWRDRDGAWVNGDTTYYQVTCWRALGENVAKSLHKGDPVLVRGTLRNRPWSSEDRSGTSLDVNASFVGPDLSRGVTLFRRTPRQRPAEATSEGPADDATGLLAADLRAPDTIESLTELEPPAF